MKKTAVFDKIYIGLILGMIVPLIVFFLYFLFRHGDVEFLKYLGFLHRYGLLFKVISLCVLVDLPLFYIFIQFKYWRGARGVVMSCFIYAITVAVYTIIT
jgi:hypothetical protein